MIKPSAAVSRCALVTSCSILIAGCTQTVRDDFSGPEISQANWFVCERPENEFGITQPPHQPFRALRMTVHPRRSSASLKLDRSGCADRENSQTKGEDERAELWEADRVMQPFGTDVWYRFSMFIDPAVRNGGKRLVIGQWKQSGGLSPFLAQRFTGRAFTITIQQNNDAPNRDPADIECRVVIAADARATERVGSSFGHHNRKRFQNVASAGSSKGIVGLRDLDEVTSEIVTTRRPKPCADLNIERLGTLPDPFGRWTDMLFHIQARPDEKGALEAWANGQPIVRVTGRIGYRTDPKAYQYFKFGPYRDPEPYSTYSMISNYRRGPTRASVE